MKARLLMEDGSLITGKGFGYQGTSCGEIVFNTGMTGYQEILTDPSYAGQVVTLTYPLIGNYGINIEDAESDRVQVSGFVVKEYAKMPNHWQMNQSLDDYLIENKIVGISDVDTRMITKRIRNIGAMNCLITTDEEKSLEELKALLDDYTFPANIVEEVSVEDIKVVTSENSVYGNIAIVDLGLKQGIGKQILKEGFDITIYPFNVTFETILKGNHKALLFSNGPGDPKECHEAIQLAKDLKDKMPLFGICLGHQVLALSLGADTYKLKFGHRGSNHPVIDLRTKKVFMTSQNHGYAVKKEDIPWEIQLTHLNVNDDTVEGLCLMQSKIESVQFHPEEGPGPTDATVIFTDWMNRLKGVD